MAYKRVNWKNNPPNSATPISAENLNIMDEGIEKAHQEIEELPEKFPKKMSQLEDDVGYAKSEDVGKVSEQLLNKINELRSPFSLLKNEDNSLTLVYKETTEE